MLQAFHILFRLLIRLLLGVSIPALLPKGQYIVYANHNSQLDAAVLFSLFRLRSLPQVHAVAAADYFSRGVLGRFAHFFFNAVMVRRRQADFRRDVLDPAREALRQGHSLVIFPEGTRGKPGEMERFKTGIGSLAIEFPDVPIVPVALIGLERTLPKPSALPVPMSCTVRVLPPTSGKELRERLGTESRKELAAELERILRESLCRVELSDSEYRLRR